MAIITKAGTPSKGSPTQFTLDKTALAAVTSVAADSYFSDSTNWKEVSLVYKSSTGSQKKILKFDASLSSPTANFTVSAKALDIFQIHKIVIKDFDSDTFEVPRSQLTTAEFDVDMSSAPVPTAYQYYKIAAKSAWFEIGSETVRKIISFSDVAFKDASGNVISMTGASLSNIYGSTNYGAANLIDGIVEQSNANDIRVYDMPNMTLYHDLFTITMASAVSVSKLLIGAQGGTTISYNMPREFKLLASNDNINFTEVFVSVPDANTDAWNVCKGTYREFSL